MTFKIDKGIELPPERVKNSYPWKELSIGDSFFVPNMRSGARQGLQSISARHGIRIAVRSVVENGVKGVRVWRIE